MEREKIHEGMNVRSSDGEKLGKIVLVSDDSFLIESGFFFPKDYTMRYDYVSHVDNGEVVLLYTMDQVKRRDFTSARTTAATDLRGGEVRGTDVKAPAAFAGPIDTPETREGYRARETTPPEYMRPGYTEPMSNPVAAGATTMSAEKSTSEFRATEYTEGAIPLGETQEIRVPLAEEDVSFSKRVHEVGHIRVRKNVVTEMRHLSFPVSHEEVDIERVALSTTTPLSAPSEGIFQEEMITVPLHEEEVEVRKYPVVREEIRIRKHVETSEQASDMAVRRETASIDKDGPYIHTQEEGFVGTDIHGKRGPTSPTNPTNPSSPLTH